MSDGTSVIGFSESSRERRSFTSPTTSASA